LKDVETIKLDDYPSVMFSISSNKVAQIRRKGSKIFLNLADHIECKDEIVARYVELHLGSMDDELRNAEDLKKEVCGINTPKGLPINVYQILPTIFGHFFSGFSA